MWRKDAVSILISSLKLTLFITLKKVILRELLILKALAVCFIFAKANNRLTIILKSYGYKNTRYRSSYRKI
jgi:hypothetical protein